MTDSNEHEDDDTEFNIGTFDPVEAFQMTLFDLVQLVEMFQADDTPLSPIEFLQATRTAHDRAKAITTTAMTALMSPVIHKIPDDVRDAFQQQIELDNLMSTPEQEREKILKHLKGITTWTKRQL